MILSKQPANRPFEGKSLENALGKLAQIYALAYSLEHDIEPPSDEDREFGAAELTPEQIKEQMSAIMRLASDLAQTEFRATTHEWRAAQESIF